MSFLYNISDIKAFISHPILISPSTFMCLTLLILIVICYQRKSSCTSQGGKKVPQLKWQDFLFLKMVLRKILTTSSDHPADFLAQYLHGCIQLFRKEGICFFLGTFKKFVVLYKPETVQPILQSNETVQKGFEYTFVKDWLRNSVFLSSGDIWQRKRKLLTPMFHNRVTRESIPLMNTHARNLADKFRASMNFHEYFDIVPLISQCCLNVTYEAMSGRKIDSSDSSSSYLTALHAICRAISARHASVWLWSDVIYFRTKRGKEYLKNLEVVDRFCEKMISESSQNRIAKAQLKPTDIANASASKLSNEILDSKHQNGPTAMEYMSDLHLKDIFTIETVKDEVNGGLFAGHDTLASGFSWTLYTLGLHPEIQRKAYSEILDVLGTDSTKDITMEDVKRLKYVECVIKEGLRLFPPSWYISRTLENDMDINDYAVVKGTVTMISIYMLHRDPEIFPNPEVFNPDRFHPDTSVGRHPFAYIPFSAGPRNCMGKKFALVETAVLLATIIRLFEIKSLLPLDKLVFSPDLIFRPGNELRMNFTRREDCT